MEILRLARTWDPLLQGLHPDTPLLKQQNTKKLMGLKIPGCMLSWDKLWTKRYKKTKKAQLPLLKRREQKQGVGSKSRALRMPPAHTPPEGRADHLGHPSGPTPGSAPTLSPSKEPALPHLREPASKGTCFVLAPPAAAGAPVKHCLNFWSRL